MIDKTAEAAVQRVGDTHRTSSRSLALPTSSSTFDRLNIPTSGKHNDSNFVRQSQKSLEKLDILESERSE